MAPSRTAGLLILFIVYCTTWANGKITIEDQDPLKGDYNNFGRFDDLQGADSQPSSVSTTGDESQFPVTQGTDTEQTTDQNFLSTSESKEDGGKKGRSIFGEPIGFTSFAGPAVSGYEYLGGYHGVSPYRHVVGYGQSGHASSATGGIGHMAGYGGASGLTSASSYVGSGRVTGYGGMGQVAGGYGGLDQVAGGYGGMLPLTGGHFPSANIASHSSLSSSSSITPSPIVQHHHVSTSHSSVVQPSVSVTQHTPVAVVGTHLRKRPYVPKFLADEEYPAWMLEAVRGPDIRKAMYGRYASALYPGRYPVYGGYDFGGRYGLYGGHGAYGYSDMYNHGAYGHGLVGQHGYYRPAQFQRPIIQHPIIKPAVVVPTSVAMTGHSVVVPHHQALVMAHQVVTPTPLVVSPHPPEMLATGQHVIHTGQHMSGRPILHAHSVLSPGCAACVSSGGFLPTLYKGRRHRVLFHNGRLSILSDGGDYAKAHFLGK